MAVNLVLLTGKVLTTLRYDTVFLVFPLVRHCLLYTRACDKASAVCKDLLSNVGLYSPISCIIEGTIGL